ncbi:MAG: hypothetical protein H7Y12_01230 [Sphingobacteriaceae bacterium]|nr:hypothetical protein [Cytophagaceae bacterium]
MKKQLLSLCGLAALVLFLTACPKNKTPPLSERIAKAWSANSVKEDATTVYTKGGASNIKPGYASFKLDLRNVNGSLTVTLTDVDGNTFTGTWELSADEKKLILRNLNPQPTGTNGVIEFTINGDPTDTTFNLTRTTASLKTGGTINTYSLTNP